MRALAATPAAALLVGDPHRVAELRAVHGAGLQRVFALALAAQLAGDHAARRRRRPARRPAACGCSSCSARSRPAARRARGAGAPAPGRACRAGWRVIATRDSACDQRLRSLLGSLIGRWTFDQSCLARALSVDTMIALRPLVCIAAPETQTRRHRLPLARRAADESLDVGQCRRDRNISLHRLRFPGVARRRRRASHLPELRRHRVRPGVAVHHLSAGGHRARARGRGPELARRAARRPGRAGQYVAYQSGRRRGRLRAASASGRGSAAAWPPTSASTTPPSRAATR